MSDAKKRKKDFAAAVRKFFGVTKGAAGQPIKPAGETLDVGFVGSKTDLDKNKKKKKK